MRHTGHLTLHELKLAPSEEHAFQCDGWCLLRTETGVGYALSADTAVSLSEGDSIAFFKGRNVTIRASQLSELDVQFFSVCTELLAGFFPLSDQHFFEKAALDAKQNFRHFPRENIVSQEFGELRADAVSIPVLETRLSMLALFVSIFEFKSKNERSVNKSLLSAGVRLEELMESVTPSEFENLSANEIAEKCGCGQRRLKQLFRERFGFSIRSMQTQLRLGKAEELLVRSNLRISQIAIQSGFHNVGLFNLIFKRRFGMTPSEWRRQGVEASRDENTPAS